MFSSTVQNVSLSNTYKLHWLDQNAKDDIYLQKQLNEFFNNELTIFDNIIDYNENIRLLADEERVILIVSGYFGKELVPTVNNLSQVLAIYVYCSNRDLHLQWTKNYKKVRAVLSHGDDLIYHLQKDARYREPLSPITVFQQSHKNVRADNAQFIWQQLFIAILLRLKPEESSSNEKLVEYLKRTYPQQLDVVEKFHQDYQPENSLQWYTKDSCIYKCLNYACRMNDFGTLVLYRYFIKSLYEQLANQYRQQKKLLSDMTLYRGQLMSPEELIQLQKSVGQFISFNSFLSTSQDLAVAEMYAGKGVLFEITTSLSNEKLDTSADVSWWNRPLFERSIETPISKPYALISGCSQFSDEDEVLFMAGTIFCLDKMEPPYEQTKPFWTAHLHLASDSDHNLKELYRYRIIELSTETTIADDLNPLLIEMGYLAPGKIEENDDETQQNQSNLPIFLLKSALSVFSTTKIQINLGKIQTTKGDYQAAIDTFMKALQGTTDVRCIAEIESNLAVVYERMKDYSTALSHCRKAEQYSNSVDNFMIMIRLYMKLEDYVAALQIIESNVLPQEKDSLKIARHYRLMGKIYEARKQFDLALENYKKSFQLFEKLYPFDRVDDVFRHNGRGGSEMKDISRHLLRLIDKTKKSDEYAVLDGYFREFNCDREEAYSNYLTTQFYRDPM
ncbi:unnamed protein product [Adineta ricciae]|uniref:Tetratricopeptide repeat protein 29 n=1 Tax=Adineta ricciae TaxID=249248 RepID=A0A815T2A8_ADIRI|nr:unnamed protein product [Adineta ricciae]CAF1497443.1 unnamed protein product [Adineta ricciae]